MIEKKKFFPVELPLIRSKINLIAGGIEKLENRVIKFDMTRMLRGKSLEVLFKVKIHGNKAEGKAIKITLLPFFIRRMMRTSISYVEDSFSSEAQDSWLRIKPFLITRRKVVRKVKKALRDEARRYISEQIKDKTTDEIFSEIMDNRLQKSLSLKLKKIYPLALCEIREIKVEKEKEKIKEEKVK